MRAFTGTHALGALTVVLLACGTSGATRSPSEPDRTITRATTAAFEWIRDDPSFPAACGLVDNRWNETHAPPGPSAERAFVEDLGGTPAFGWEWSWPQGNDVLTYPEIVCGGKPWDLGSDPYPSGGAFPFRPEAATLTVSYAVTQRLSGTSNLAFSLWAVSHLGAPLASLTNEIMVWIDVHGMRPAGSWQGSVESGGTTFDAWVMPGQWDHSGSSPAVWTYAAFVAREPRLAGPLDLTPLLDWLRANHLPGGQPILPEGTWIGDLELGSEVVGGTGVVEVTGFGFAVGPR